MENLIQELFEIIKDYRDDDAKMSVEVIKSWVHQFNETDQEFILTELKYLLKEKGRYFSKETIEKGLRNMIPLIAEKQGFSSPKEFLKVATFIDHQPEGKSQKVFLNLLREFAIENFEIDINDTIKNPQYYIYIDDFFCTGDTLFKGLTKREDNEDKGWLHQKNGETTNLEYLKSTGAKILFLYFAIHNLNYSKFQYRLNKELNEDVESHYLTYAFLWIDNNYKRADSKLEYVFPIRANQPQAVIDYFNELNVDQAGVFRNPNSPKIEDLFSSPENRIRFENIILEKGLYLYDLAGSGRSLRMRPLGYGLQSHKNLGFGTLCFSYRNVPFNTPLVFWYQWHDWKPLFERKFISYNTTFDFDIDFSTWFKDLDS